MILVCGEALIDLLVGGPAGAGLACQAVPGGSPFNVAIGVARLGGAAAFLANVSTDVFGRYLLETLSASGVDTRLVRASPRPTTISVAVTRQDGEADYAFYGENAADRSLLTEQLPAVLPVEVEAIAIGSYSLAVDPTAQAIEHLVARDGSERIVSIDPNIRANVIGDVAAWRPRFERLLPRCSIIKTSIEDLNLLYGSDLDVPAWAAKWLTSGPLLIAVTRGGDGASVFFGQSVFDMPVRPVSVVDTVGAGDTFHAALLVSLSEQGLLRPDSLAAASVDSIRQAARFALTAASITCSRQGADLPRRAEVDAVV